MSTNHRHPEEARPGVSEDPPRTVLVLGEARWRDLLSLTTLGIDGHLA